MFIESSQHSPTALGRYGEQLAVQALAQAGYRILEQNWTAEAGEVDIIAFHRKHLVAVEVKTRRGKNFGDPVSSVTARQLRRIHHGLLDYKRAVYPRLAHAPIRVDVVGVIVSELGETSAELLSDVS